MDTFLQNLRFALRMLRKSPGFTLAAVLTLALGIGANTAIFSVVNGVLLRPLPYEKPEQLLMLWEGTPQQPEASLAFPNYRDYRDRSHTLASVGAFRSDTRDLTGVDSPERLKARMASASLLPTLGVQPALGRNFTAQEDTKGGPPVVMLEHAFWVRRFGKDPSVLGRTLTLNGQPHTVVGVLPERFRFFDARDVWLPLEDNPLCGESRGCHPGLYAVARPKPGVSVSQVRADLETVGYALQKEYPRAYSNYLPKVNGLHAEIVKDVKGSLFMLLAAVAGVLLIATINVANLLLARGAARSRELAIRAALGAGKGTLVMQMLVESALVGLLGGVFGLLLAMWGVDVLASSRPDAIPSAATFSVDGNVLAFTLGVSLLVGIVLGVLPALRGSQVALAGAMKGSDAQVEAAAGSGRRRLRARDVLVVGEVSLALVLLVAAGLLLRTFVQLQGLDLGFRPDGLLTLGITAPESRFDLAALRAFPERVRERLAGAPGVKSVTVAAGMPIIGAAGYSFTVVGRPEPATLGEQPMAIVYPVDPAYFETLGISLLQGRLIGAQDRLGAPRVVVVDEAIAKQLFPDGNVVGQRIKYDGDVAEIVGVVRHVVHDGAGQKEGAPFQFYAPLAQFTDEAMKFTREFVVAVRANGSSEEAALGLVPTVRSEITALDPDQAISDVKPMEQVVSESLGERRFMLGLIGLFGVLALVLAGIGIYSVMSYAVVQRTREMGIRMALGAKGGDVLRLVVGHGFRLALAGVLIGVLAAWALTRLLSGMLAGVSATDPTTFALVALGLGAVAVLASYLPARRAVRVDPVVSLKAE
ncbi:ABC transporter permease [Aggregicoccus sp. 17bor-14]|uniref:ABC transporter permease n=1 Tax=Myxococcaceae TaxID=31 RepID=UPI00129CDDEF|nr:MULTISPECIES: ABC transporter permease [Myxococcaceae]MBF5045671.1 ABC transporter permease [Simulacricoccus sp. 17bor-14]MRI91408.1 ABC transporter permease [Aggregicoccus sp. 17bor-14]